QRLVGRLRCACRPVSPSRAAKVRRSVLRLDAPRGQPAAVQLLPRLAASLPASRSRSEAAGRRAGQPTAALPVALHLRPRLTVAPHARDADSGSDAMATWSRPPLRRIASRAPRRGTLRLR